YRVAYAGERKWDRHGRRNFVPRRPTNEGGRRVKKTTVSLRDSSLEERKAPRVCVPNVPGSTRSYSICPCDRPGQGLHARNLKNRPHAASIRRARSSIRRAASS